tara:strand:- start:428 stop:805 length:378 start_codon:yes stop_codon:yes gene_type:complete
MIDVVHVFDFIFDVRFHRLRFYNPPTNPRYSSDQGVPCTTRQLESLIRLAQARAKADLCELVSESHAKEVVELMNEALFAALEDGDGNFDTSRGQFGSNGSNSAIKVEVRFVVSFYRWNHRIAVR